jgi:hypothetical protein
MFKHQASFINPNVKIKVHRSISKQEHTNGKPESAKPCSVSTKIAMMVSYKASLS